MAQDTHRMTDEELQQFVEAMNEASFDNTAAENRMIEIAQNWDTHDDYSGEHLLTDMEDS